MGALTIDDTVLRELAAMAERRGVTREHLAAELRREGLDDARVRPRLREIMEQIAAMTPTGVTQTDSVDLLREERDL